SIPASWWRRESWSGRVPTSSPVNPRSLPQRWLRARPPTRARGSWPERRRRGRGGRARVPRGGGPRGPRPRRAAALGGRRVPAAGDLEGPAVAALTPVAVYVFRGGRRLRYALPEAAPDATPALDPAGGVAIADGAVLWALPAIGRAGMLRLQAGALQPSGEL